MVTSEIDQIIEIIEASPSVTIDRCFSCVCLMWRRQTHEFTCRNITKCLWITYGKSEFQLFVLKSYVLSIASLISEL
jgi:hypothetical protein